MRIAQIVLAIILAAISAGAAHAQSAPRLPVIGVLAIGQLRTAPPYPALERALAELA